MVFKNNIHKILLFCLLANITAYGQDSDIYFFLEKNEIVVVNEINYKTWKIDVFYFAHWMDGMNYRTDYDQGLLEYVDMKTEHSFDLKKWDTGLPDGNVKRIFYRTIFELL